MKIYLTLALATGLFGCSQPYDAPILYQAKTPNCQDWLDGSRFELPQEIGVYAAPPKAVDGNVLKLGLMYAVPKGTEATFESHAFAIAIPRGEVVGTGIIMNVTSRAFEIPNSKREALPNLPFKLRGELTSGQTMYEFDLHFREPLPARFDFTPPKMVITGVSYPVRTYTYRYFAERKSYGLCS